MNSSQKYNKLNDSKETRIALLEQSIGHIHQTLIRIESRIDGLDKSSNTKIDGLNESLSSKINELNKSLNSKIDKIDIRIDKVENRLWQILFLISSSIIGMSLGKIFHWF
jgi:hypothetical protein